MRRNCDFNSANEVSRGFFSFAYSRTFQQVAPLRRPTWRQPDISKAPIEAYNTRLSPRTVLLVAADANKHAGERESGVGFLLTRPCTRLAAYLQAVP